MKENSSTNFMVKKCSIHPKQTYVGICMNNQCHQKQLACAKCLVFFHSDHPKSILFFADLKDSGNTMLKPWDAGVQIQKLEQSLNSALNIDKQVNKKMEQLEKIIYEKIDAQKMKALVNMMKYHSISIKQTKTIQTNNKISYSINYLQKYLAEFLSGKLPQKSFNQVIDKIINSRLELDKLISNNNTLNSQTRKNQSVDQIVIDDIAQNTINIINKLDQIIVRPINNDWHIIKNPFSNKFIKTIVNGSIFEFSAQGENQIIYGNVMKDKPLTYLITIDLLSQQKNQESKMERKIKKQPKKKQKNYSQDDEQQESQQEIKNAQQKKQQLQPKQKNINGLKNIYIGFIQSQLKQDEKIYSKKLTFGERSSSSAQSYDIITGAMIGSFMTPNQFFFEGQIRVNLNQTVKLSLQTNNTIDLFFHYNPICHISISDKNKKSFVECKHFYDRSTMQYGQSTIISNKYRPFILCNKSQVRITIKQINNIKSDQNRSTIYPGMPTKIPMLMPPVGFGYNHMLRR